MTTPDDDWTLGEPNFDDLEASPAKARATKRAWDSLEGWLAENLERLRERVETRYAYRLRALKEQLDQLRNADRLWERDFDRKLERLQRFEAEFGSTKTAEQTRKLFREARDQMTQRESRWRELYQGVEKATEEFRVE